MKILAAGDSYMPRRYFEQGSRRSSRHTTRVLPDRRSAYSRSTISGVRIPVGIAHVANAYLSLSRARPRTRGGPTGSRVSTPLDARAAANPDNFSFARTRG